MSKMLCVYYKAVSCTCVCLYQSRVAMLLMSYAEILTICARRYICAWLAVRVGLDGLPRRTAC